MSILNENHPSAVNVVVVYIRTSKLFASKSPDVKAGGILDPCLLFYQRALLRQDESPEGRLSGLKDVTILLSVSVQCVLLRRNGYSYTSGSERM
jgi:hypothetical protein